jgi:dTDP-4-dehydrorhamnose 3,5-epimerase
MHRDVVEFEMTTHQDNRGTFSNIFDFDYLFENEFDLSTATISQATNRMEGTVRGLHYQASPFEQPKVVWCSSGSVFDVVVDINPASESYGEWRSFILESNAPRALFIPAGFAHGYQTLSDNAVVSYLLLGKTSPEHSRCVVWNDQSLGIKWPLQLSEISQRDKAADTWPPKF